MSEPVNSPIAGKVKLRSGLDAIADDGLAVRRLRVELSEKEKPTSAWITELRVFGDLPWHKGEERRVELRIMSDEFANYVDLNSPNLLIKRGDEILGDFEFDNS